MKLKQKMANILPGLKNETPLHVHPNLTEALRNWTIELGKWFDLQPQSKNQLSKVLKSKDQANAVSGAIPKS